MKKLLTRMRLEPWKVQTAATSIPRCREGQFAVSELALAADILSPLLSGNEPAGARGLTIGDFGPSG